MKKQKTFKMQPLFRREKDYTKLINQPDTIKELAEIANKMQASANKLNEVAKDLTDWHVRICTILPAEFQNNNELKEDIANLVAKYDNQNK